MPLSDKQACLVQCRYISQSGAFHVAIGKYPVADKWSWVWKHTGKDDILSWYNAYRNQLYQHNFQTFFYPTFFFCNWLLHRWNGFYTWSQSKISLLSPLIIGSKLTFISSFGAWSNETPPMPFYRSTRSQSSCQIKFLSKNGWEISSSIFGWPLLPILHT